MVEMMTVAMTMIGKPVQDLKRHTFITPWTLFMKQMKPVFYC